MKTMYEVERVNTDAKGIITYADSWGKESTLVDSYEEALKVVENIDSRGYDEVLINKLTIEDDEVTDSEQIESYKVSNGFAVARKTFYVVNHVIDPHANEDGRGMGSRVELAFESEDKDLARKFYEAQGNSYELVEEIREWFVGDEDYDIADYDVLDEK